MSILDLYSALAGISLLPVMAAYAFAAEPPPISEEKIHAAIVRGKARRDFAQAYCVPVLTLDAEFARPDVKPGWLKIV